MRRRWAGAVIAAGALLVDPTTIALSEPPVLEAVRLERVSAVPLDRVPRSSAVEGASPRSEGHDIPLSGDGKHLIVDGTLNGMVSGPMLIDTGASYCVLTRGTAAKLGLKPRAQRTIPVATANGQVDADLVEIDAVQLRSARVAGVDAVIMDAVEPPLIGIIGLNFLTRYRFSVDLAEGTLRLEP
jgi:clan AA aspartic protease (TIGR02281 family)